MFKNGLLTLEELRVSCENIELNDTDYSTPLTFKLAMRHLIQPTKRPSVTIVDPSPSGVVSRRRSLNEQPYILTTSGLLSPVGPEGGYW